MDVKISPSILASDFSALGKEVRSLEKGGADLVHIDVMDGHFVPNITIGAPVVKALRPRTSLPFDVHLMISDPETYIPDFIKAGADLVCFHIESECDPAKCVATIREAGVKAAVALKPGTPGEAVFPYLADLDMVLVMTVEPGFGGQSFMAGMTDKIRLIRTECEKRGLATDVEVDGGITDKTIALCAEAGANVFVAGSYVFRAEDRGDAIKRLRNAAQKI